MGAGKTTVGGILAPLLKIPFIDLDDVIASRTGLAPQHYIRRFGEGAFRKIEKICLRRTLENAPSVLAAGGGVVLDAQNRQAMFQSGFVVWMNPPLAKMIQRLRAMKNRPLLPGRPEPIRSLYRQRLPFYRQCHWRVDPAGEDPKEVANAIAAKYREFIRLHAPRPAQQSALPALL